MNSEKINTQYTITPKNSNYKNIPKPSYTGLWYPTAHPLKIWRKNGTKQHLTTSTQNNKKLCNQCKPLNMFPGKAFKLLGKNNYGINKLTSHTNETNCDLCDPTKGPNGTNSAGAKIRSAVTLLDKEYNTTTGQYLKSRCKDFKTRNIIHKKKGIAYFDKQGKAKWPSSNPSTSAGTYITNCCSTKKCNETTYKPSNPQYATQGAVESSARLARLKYNEINTTNNSFKQQYQRNFSYNSNNSLYFIKNKTQPMTKCCYSKQIKQLP